ncbi:glutamate--tRNA ligase, putative [Plasmodium berghei]|uniref:glutamate--tRNA ligase n=6 Tax=Plasmodium berghei TaxID=5821 RepID=A0A509AR09_PLABA|nr:glutamate--tRNA ligase, putative [Plasmodium berghei ANKA]CXJ05045.1 glutamate--tRNA ligase, putative [Plasmodium berghei]SCL98762.1 glutamate--tRNA ligase, putative [Plasmodium berghei]SCM16893.1 glutamate--tRNA ligase, putative [Plasmodium berghei]SCN28126.1 glutamate--tRNA ligase, putative [Plasmodium berghei]VUC58007.1 glutamate--tRNA ligase, putative [Plasmodium berghei ANKA]|eukprot:XP_034423776.1 glutamate--tRNA ligase, putative [Plasmodium berghei ANKA]
MIKDSKINIYYGKNYPFLCRTVFNIYQNNIKKKTANNLNDKKIKEICVNFINDKTVVEDIKVEFVRNTVSDQTRKNTNTNNSVTSSDKIFAINLDFLLKTNLYYFTSYRENINRNIITNVFFQAQYNEWIDFLRNKDIEKNIIPICEHINKHLYLNTFLSFHYLTLSDIYIYYEMHKYFSGNITTNLKYPKQYKNINRWFRLIKALLHDHVATDAELIQNLKVKEKIFNTAGSGKRLGNNGNKYSAHSDHTNTKGGATSLSSYEGKLQNAEKGKVVTRFPPEPSGYLHIGHIKAAFLNNYYANIYEGKMLLRFDDTNPVLEDVKFENSIIEDLETLSIKYEKISYTSDYFQLLEEYCIKLIKMNKAYADDTNVDEMRNQRGEGIESVNRNNSIETNLKLFEEMRNGTDIGKKNCIRAKINMSSKNKCMRDPVLYRCIIDIPHHRHGFKYKCYPTYDFACPIIDSIEGVTHALRTNEYSDRIEQYNWFIYTLELRNVHIYEFSRLAFVKTVMSKRKLKWFVENNIVDGWTDPRMPTIKGILRRGLTKEALFQFILEQGPSKAGNLMQWDKLWSINKQIIDPNIPRFSSVDMNNGVILKLTDLKENEIIEKTRDLHVKNKSLGTCTMYYTQQIYIELEDAQMIEANEEITLIKLGNVIVKEIIKDTDNVNKIKEIIAVSNFDGDFKTTKKKIHWLPYIPDKLINCTLYEYDHLITVDKFENDNKEDWTNCINQNSKFETVAYAEPALIDLKVSDKFQFERRGYFIVDKITENKHFHLIKIPDGKSKNMSIISTKVNPQNLSGTKK